MKDVLIIGAGPAGLSAGVYCARKMLDTLLISGDIGGQAMLSWEIENYLGYQLISGVELVERFRDHLENFKVELKESCKVTSLVRTEESFTATTNKGDEFSGRAVIVASGKVPIRLGIPGEDKYRGRGVAYCATCDGPLFRDKEVAVIGGGNAGLGATLQLAQFARGVNLITEEQYLRGDEVRQNRVLALEAVDVFYSSRVTAINGNTFVESIDLMHDNEKRTLPAQGVFVEIGSKPSTSFLPVQVELNDGGEIIIDANNETNTPGLFAAGDVTNVSEKQIIIAAGEGAKASLSAYNWLLKQEYLRR
ncbi:MAG: hypothetical protein A2W01_11090 [Candidatus Solincola sediminis]|uniref:FAD/NAD(P)-binding domain-containing protein n=1 Tax=Candidatus Solincola sediminis TaxID=1797199 RepID=A0A1F2WNZ2_9ACTN|nr:MAG: hypothetical protein A2Y75_10310 [Candidatus Solincola sediminis]OFW61848.1 MAG: hypothetical protein A2W01_11090 [Candidatus Solincola sediminis]